MRYEKPAFFSFLGFILIFPGCTEKMGDGLHNPRNLRVPPGSETDSTVTLIWDKPQDYSDVTGYEVYLGKSSAGRVTKTNYTVAGLVPGENYSFYVKSLRKGNKRSGAGNRVSHSTRQPSRIFNVTDYGAMGDGLVMNTGAIQKAIDDCSPGGTVLIPAGTFLSGAIFLKSDMTLYIAGGGILKGSEDPDDYSPFIRNRYSGWEMETYASLINAGTLDHTGTCNVNNLSIRGKGKICGGGAKLGNTMMDKEGYYSRARLICLMSCNQVNIQGVTLENSPSWTLHYIYCKNVTIHDLTIISENIRNGDGIDPDSSTGSYIFNCTFSNSDDCIAIKSGKNPEGYKLALPTKDLLIADCNFVEGHGLSIGSEMSGGVSNITIRDCFLSPAIRNGLQIKAPKERGGHVKNITVKDCNLNKIRIITEIGYNTAYEPAPETPSLGEMEFVNIDMRNGDITKPVIDVHGFRQNAVPVVNVRFSNIVLPDSSTVALTYCKRFSFREVVTAQGQKPLFNIQNSDEIDY